MLKNFNKAQIQKPQNQVQQPTQKQTAVVPNVKPTITKGVSKIEQMELLAFLDKCTQIMNNDRLHLRNLIKEGNGQEVEEILLKNKKKQDTANLALDLRKYLSKTKVKPVFNTPTSATTINNNLASNVQQKPSQINTQQAQQIVDVQQTKRVEQEQIYRQQIQQQQRTFTNTVQMQQIKNLIPVDENQNYEKQIRQQQYEMQQQKMNQQQQMEQQLKQQNQYPQIMNPFRRPQQVQMQEYNKTNSISNTAAFKEYEEQQKKQQNAIKFVQKITEQTEEDDLKFQQLQQSKQSQQVEVNDQEESTLQNRLQDEENEAEFVEDQEQVYTEQDNEQEYLREDDDVSQGFQSHMQYSQQQSTELKQQPHIDIAISGSAIITQNSQELTPEQQNQYLQNFENQNQSYQSQQQSSSQFRRSSVAEDEENLNQSQIENTIFREQQRILQQDERINRIIKEGDYITQQALQRTELSGTSFSRVNTQQNEEDVEQYRETVRDEEDQEEFFDHINDLDQKDPNLNKVNLIKLGSFQRGNSNIMADDPITPMNHPVHMDSDVQRAPVKHRMEEINEQMDNQDPFNFQRRVDTSSKKQFSEIRGEQKQLTNYNKGEESIKKLQTQESGNKYNQNSNVYQQNLVRKSNNNIPNDLLQHNYEFQMEKAYFEKMREQKSVQNCQYDDKQIHKQDSTRYYQVKGNSGEKQQFNHMNLFNCAVSGFNQDPVSYYQGKELYDPKQSYNVESQYKNMSNQYTEREDTDDSCSVNFANEKVGLETSVRESNLQNPIQPTYAHKSEILKAFSNEQSSEQQMDYYNSNFTQSPTFKVAQKTYDNYYPERMTIDISNNINQFQKKITPVVPTNIYSTPSQPKYASLALSLENNSNGKILSQNLLSPAIIKSPAFRREYLRGTADPSANKDRVTSVISPSREQSKLSPSKDPIKLKYNNLFTSPKLMSQCKVGYDKENIGFDGSPRRQLPIMSPTQDPIKLKYNTLFTSPSLMSKCNVEFDKEKIGFADSQQTQQEFIYNQSLQIEKEVQDFFRSTFEKSATKLFQTSNSNVFTNWEQLEINSSRIRQSSATKQSINVLRSPYTNTNLQDSLIKSPNLKLSIHIPQFLAQGNQYTHTEKNLFIAKFSLFNKTAQEVFNIIFGNQMHSDQVTRYAFRNSMQQQYQNVSIEDIDSFFNFLDINQDQILDINEVGPVLMNMCNYRSKESGKLIQVFNFIDNDKKGFITRFETEILVQPQIQKKNYHKSAINLSKQLFREVDFDNKGYLTYWQLYSRKNYESVRQLIDVITS